MGRPLYSRLYKSRYDAYEARCAYLYQLAAWEAAETAQYQEALGGYPLTRHEETQIRERARQNIEHAVWLRFASTTSIATTPRLSQTVENAMRHRVVYP